MHSIHQLPQVTGRCGRECRIVDCSRKADVLGCDLGDAVPGLTKILLWCAELMIAAIIVVGFLALVYALEN
jgi:hypothetical protein